MSAADGLSERALQEYTASFSLDPNITGTNGAPVAPYLEGDLLRPQVVLDGLASVALPPLPTISSPVIAIDPDAEGALLGDSGGFLEPLRVFSGLETETGPLSCDLVGCPDGSRLSVAEQQTFRLLTNGAAGYQNSALKGIYGGDSSTFVPYLLNVDHSLVGLRLDAQFDQIGEDGRGRSLGRDSIDLESAALPFADSDLRLTWPGAMKVDGVTIAQIMRSTRYLMRPSLRHVEGVPELGYATRGLIDPNSNPVASDLSTGGPGVTQSYGSRLDSTGLATGYLSSPGAAPLQVGVFDSAALEQSKSASGVPIGGYDPPVIQVASGSNIQADLTPSLIGSGASQRAAAAVVRLADLPRLGFDDGVDVIRVRVDANAGATPENLARQIAKVAGEINALGLNTYIVRGASLQDVNVALPAFVTSPADQPAHNVYVDELTGKSVIVRLAAASAVDAGLSSISDAFYLVAAVSAVGLGAVSIAFAAPGRRRDATQLSLVGYTRSRRLAWLLMEEAAAYMVILAVASAAIVVSAGAIHGAFRGIVEISVIAYTICVIAGVISGSRGSRVPTNRSHAQKERDRRRRSGSSMRAAEQFLWVGGATLTLLLLATGVWLVPVAISNAAVTRLGAAVVRDSTWILLLACGVALIAVIASWLQANALLRARHRKESVIRALAGGWTRRARVTAALRTQTGQWLAVGVLTACGWALMAGSALSVVAPPAATVAAVWGAAAILGTAIAVRSSWQSPETRLERRPR